MQAVSVHERGSGEGVRGLAYLYSQWGGLGVGVGGDGSGVM